MAYFKRYWNISFGAAILHKNGGCECRSISITNVLEIATSGTYFDKRAATLSGVVLKVKKQLALIAAILKTCTDVETTSKTRYM